jgi:hypothetical protein
LYSADDSTMQPLGETWQLRLESTSGARVSPAEFLTVDRCARIEKLVALRPKLMARLAAVGPYPDPTVKLRTVVEVADAIMEILHPTPFDMLVRRTGGFNAYAQETAIYVGETLLQKLDTVSVLEVMLHEAAHIALGHSLPGPSGRPFAQEFAADRYAAVGAWLVDRRPSPGMISWLKEAPDDVSDTHPASHDRNDAMRTLMFALDRKFGPSPGALAAQNL